MWDLPMKSERLKDLWKACLIPWVSIVESCLPIGPRSSSLHAQRGAVMYRILNQAPCHRCPSKNGARLNWP